MFQKPRSTSIAAPSSGNSGFSFGSGSGGGGAPSGGTGFSLGPPAQSGSLFGNQNNQGSTTTTTGFGSAGGGGFGSKPMAPSNSAGSMFGGNSNTNTNSSTGFNNNSGGGLFGGANNTNTNSGGLFGNNQGNNNSSSGGSGGLFGNTTTNTNTNTGGLFGNKSANTGSSMFGNTNSNTNTSGGSLFGTNANTNSNTLGGGLFGNNTNTNSNTGTGSGGLFGNNAPAQSSTPSGGLFGNNASAQSNNAIGGFGNSTTTTNNSLFNSNFGQSSATPGNSFFGSNGAAVSTPNQSLLSMQSPLVASIDQGSFSLTSSVNSTVDRSLGALTASRRGAGGANSSLLATNSTANTPTAIRKNNPSFLSRSPFKAAPSPRTQLSGARASPYAVRKRENQLHRTKSLFFTPSNHRESLRSERSYDALSKFSEKPTSDVKRLVINRKSQRPIESITGSKSMHKLEGTPQQHQREHSRNESIASNTAASVTHAPSSVTTSPRVQKTVSRATFRSSVTPSLEGKAFEMNKVAKENGYWISPNLQQLYKMSIDQLRSVQDLTIGRKGYGQIRYNGPVDLSKVLNLGDILGNTVAFGPQTVCVYPDDSNKAEPGHELNMPATVTLENIFATDKKTRERITDPGDPRIAKHINRLKRAIESKGGEFITYDVDFGLWTFKVPHFSVWGLTDDEDDDDEDLDMESEQAKPDQNGPPATQGQAALQFTQESQSQSQPQPQFQFQSNPQVGDTFQDPINDLFQAPPSHDIDRRQPAGDGLIQQQAPELENQLPSNAWGIPNANFSYASDDENGEPDDIEGAEPHDITDLLKELEQDHEDGLDGLQPEFDISDYEQYPRPTSRNWIEQLKYSGSFDSPLAIRPKKKLSSELQQQEQEQKQLQNEENDLFTAADLDNYLFGGSQSLKKSSALQYRKAAEKLRFPSQLSSKQIGRFNSGTGKLVLLKNTSVEVASLEDKLSAKSEGKPDFAEQLKMSRITQRANGIPSAVPDPAFSFKALHRLYSSNGNRHEARAWQLAAILFDPTPVEIPYGVDEQAKDKINEKWRRQQLSKWLESCVLEDVKHDLSTCKSTEESIFVHLTGNQVQEACEAALRSKNFHLATVLPMLGSADVEIRRDARHQLDGWVQSKAINDIPEYIRKLYELLAGNCGVAQGQKASGTDNELAPLYLSQGLDWMRAFGLRLWYETSLSDPIAAAVESYRQASEDPVTRTAKPLVAGDSTSSSQKYDLCYQLLRLYGSISPSLTSVLEPLGASCLDYRVPWHLYVVLVQASGKFKDFNGRIGDRLSVNYACQLEAEGLWIESLFVLSHVSDDEVAKRYIEQVLANHTDQVSAVKDKLINELKIDSGLICQVQALKYRYERDYLEEAYSLIEAGLWEEAHKTVIDKVAPKAVIENRSERLIELLSRFKYPSAVSSWKNGGQIYLDYARFRLGSDSPNEDKQVQVQDGQQQLGQRLLDSLSRVSIDNFDIRVAANIMSSFVGQRLKTATGEKVLAMKMSGNEYLQQTIDLSVEYFKQRVF